MKPPRFSQESFQDEEENDSAGGLRWLLTYSDMITLLLIFFIIMYAISETNSKKLATFVQTVEKGFHMDQRPLKQIKNKAKNRKETANVEAAGDSAEKQKIYDNLYTKLTGLTDYGVSVVSREKGVVIKIENSRFFASGTAKLTEDAKSILRYSAKYLKTLKNPLSIEGHTDTVPIHTREFPSNWELSTMRALAVLRFFEENGINPRRLSATGYGQYMPIAPNDLITGNPLNRRVEIVILNYDYHSTH